MNDEAGSQILLLVDGFWLTSQLNFPFNADCPVRVALSCNSPWGRHF
jgi:hypothetical protein